MKPSEVLSKLFLESDMGKSLDKRFIDKAELKDKIKLILDKHRDRFPTSIENGAIIYREELEKEILEMLK